MSEELKLCPFCGGKASVYEAEMDDQKFMVVACEDCGISTQGYENESEAVAAWNKRVT